MTERLYYADPFCVRFDARVERLEQIQGQPAAILDRTAFYPTSGGQPFDTGVLDGVKVAEVIELDDGTIAHLLEGEVRAGGTVHGEVDWPRRFDHMQQHTGQHVLSAAFDRSHQAKTVGFHLGAVVSTIDLSRDLPAPAIAAAEAEANHIVWDDRPVSIRFATDDEAAALPLRKDPGRTGVLRLVDVEDFDLSACGGTHVSRTGAIGMIAVLSSERFRGGLRIEFVCGQRALRSFRTFREAVAGSIRGLSVLPEELPGAIERAQAENKDLRKTLRRLQEQLAGFEAAAVQARGRPVGDRQQVVEALDGWDATGLKSLAVAIASSPGHDVALFSTTAPFLAVIAVSPEGRADAAAVLRALTARFGGKGGGKRDLAQGGGLAGEVTDILEAARQALAGG
jgi:alanyl-tRNA synthetase